MGSAAISASDHPGGRSPGLPQADPVRKSMAPEADRRRAFGKSGPFQPPTPSGWDEEPRKIAARRKNRYNHPLENLNL
jgi:hypothetical protein